MPQIKQIQTVYWGPFRPDPIELATDGINVFTGMNGVGKTCLLDAIKLMLGVDDLKAKPAEYIYSSQEGSRRVDKAYLKAVFDNPIRSRQQGRVFADAGWGCENAENVTAVCEVTSSRRRYTIVPGYVSWGEQRPLPEDLALLREVPLTRWLTPRAWSELLARAGVPQALLGVIALKQGETDKALGANPEQLLRQMLELTGKQQTLDDFRAAKTNLVDERGRYEAALARFESEERQLVQLARLVERHEEFSTDERRAARLNEVELPLARRRKIEEELAETQTERDQRAGQLDVARDDLSRLDKEIPALEQRERDLTSERDKLQHSRAAAQERLGRATSAVGASERDVSRARETIAAGEALDELTEAAAAARAGDASRAARAFEKAREEDAQLERDLAELRAGRPPRPAGLDQFRALLQEREIETVLLAERLEVPETLAAEAVLGDGVWALIVAGEDFEHAVQIAREQSYRLPIVRAGDGSPGGVFSGADGLPEALAYLAELELPLGAVPGVEADGVLRGLTWAALRAPEQPALGEAARAAAFANRQARRAELAEALPRLAEDARAAAEVARALAAGLEAQSALPGLLSQLVEAMRECSEADAARAEAEREHDSLLCRSSASSKPSSSTRARSASGRSGGSTPSIRA